MIIGQPGSGKSTLARALGEITGLPVFHMDRIHWMAGWAERPKADKIPMAHAIEKQESWIFEGGLSATYASRLARADTLIWLDVAWQLRMLRVIQRSWRYRGQSRPDLPTGCPERFDAGLVEFLSFIWYTRHTSRARLAALFDSADASVDAYKLTNVRETRSFLEGVAEGSRPVIGDLG